MTTCLEPSARARRLRRRSAVAALRRREAAVPPVSDYSHWGEEAAIVWYADNRGAMRSDDPPEPDDELERDCD